MASVDKLDKLREKKMEPSKGVKMKSYMKSDKKDDGAPRPKKSKMDVMHGEMDFQNKYVKNPDVNAPYRKLLVNIYMH